MKVWPHYINFSNILPEQKFSPVALIESIIGNAMVLKIKTKRVYCKTQIPFTWVNAQCVFRPIGVKPQYNM